MRELDVIGLCSQGGLGRVGGGGGGGGEGEAVVTGRQEKITHQKYVRQPVCSRGLC